MDRRVVVTGYGVVTPFGYGDGSFDQTIFAGKHGFKDIESFDTSNCFAKRGGEAVVADRTYRAFGEYCAMQALQMAGIDRVTDRSVLKDTLVAVGNLGDGGMLRDYYYHQFGSDTLDRESVKPMSEISIMGRKPFQQAEFLAELIGSEADRLGFTNACVASANAIGYGVDQIALGRSECVLAGGINVLHPLVYYNFDSSRAMARDIVRPFSKHRSGLLIGDGAAMLVLESWEHAKKRGAVPLAEIIGWGISSDGFHVTQPHPQGDGLARAMRSALKRAGITPSQIDYINAHGTGTPLNDISETRALKQVFGDHARHVPISSTKSTTGHLLEAAGAVEAVISIVALLKQMIPPTANYLESEDKLDLDYVTEGPRSKRLEVVMSNSCAFGGNNCSILFKGVNPDVLSRAIG